MTLSGPCARPAKRQRTDDVGASVTNGGETSARNGRETSATNGGETSARNGGRTPATNGGETSATNGESSIAAATRHGTHWYRDGSIVLHVDDVLFRVHQTILERHSDFFKDLFSVPQPEGEEQVEGCPIVRLGGDRSADWVHLLDAMYDSMYFEALVSQELKDNFPCISGILRLAIKYLITSYRKRCIGILSCYFPSGATWTPPKDFPGGIRPSQCGAMISLGRELDLPALLPSAFLILASYLTISSKTESIYTMPSLTTQDKADLCHGTLSLLSAQADDMFPFPHFFTPAETCQASGNCSVEAGSKNYRRQPYRVFIFVHEDFLNVKAVVCEACWVNVKNIFREGRQKTWERLPEIFHLGKDWNELRRIQDNDYS